VVRQQAKDGKEKSSEYEFDRVFKPSDDQLAVFKDTEWLVQSVMDGYNVCIFAYGQTGSGKTWTMEGPSDNRGVNFRSLSELFRIKAVRAREFNYKIKVSMKEVYNEKIRDLLADKQEKDMDYKIRMGESGIFVEGLTLEPVETEEDVLALMRRGNSNRATGVTNMNEHSSRSHSMLTVEVEGENKVAGIRYYGKLHLIDLAGSERLSRTQAVGDRLKEAQAINKSLSALGNVIEALQQKRPHVPYRDSKLTFLLQDSLGGHAKTLMFINVSPTLIDAEETTCSLQFATRVRKCELGQATKNTGKAPPSSGEESDDAPAAAKKDGAKTKTTTGVPKSVGSKVAKTPSKKS